MDTARIDRYVSHKWDEDIVPRLVEYIRIPNKSPLFDPDWVAHGYMDQAVELMAGWARAQPISGMQVEVVRLEGRTPLIFIDIPGTDPASDDCVLLYGHLDKQPEMTGWAEDLGPWKPVQLEPIRWAIFMPCLPSRQNHDKHHDISSAHSSYRSNQKTTPKDGFLAHIRLSTGYSL